MSRYLNTIWCDGCGAEITWSPVIKDHRDFCCDDCSSGLPCECGARQDWDDERRDRSADAMPGQGGIL
jgi:hypothetical protein